MEALVARARRGGPASRELRDLLADQAELAESAGESTRAAELWSRAAVLAEERLRDPDGAAGYHARVVALEPRAASFDALARLADARGDARQPPPAWLEKLRRGRRPDRRAATSILRLAEALVSAGQPDARGRAAGRVAREAHPEAEPLRARLAALYRERRATGRSSRGWSPTPRRTRPDKATRMARLLEAANLFTDRCGEPERAIPLLEQASDLAPEDQAVRLAPGRRPGAAPGASTRRAPSCRR